MVARALFELARHPLMGRLVGLGFAHGSALLPVRRVLTTERVIVFHHPRPAWPGHLLIVPKHPIPTLRHLAAADNAAYLPAILTAAQLAVAARDLTERGFVLCANGGPRQEVGQVHFHLYTDWHEVDPWPGGWPVAGPRDDAGLLVLPHPRPTWETHLLIAPEPALPPLTRLPAAELTRLPPLLAPLARLDERYRLTARGYSVIIQEDDLASRDRLALHVIAGPRRAED
jgi:histidine triad (HIT) family protein